MDIFEASWFVSPKDLLADIWDTARGDLIGPNKKFRCTLMPKTRFRKFYKYFNHDGSSSMDL